MKAIEKEKKNINPGFFQSCRLLTDLLVPGMSLPTTLTSRASPKVDLAAAACNARVSVGSVPHGWRATVILPQLSARNQ